MKTAKEAKELSNRNNLFFTKSFIENIVELIDKTINKGDFECNIKIPSSGIDTIFVEKTFEEKGYKVTIESGNYIISWTYL